MKRTLRIFMSLLLSFAILCAMKYPSSAIDKSTGESVFVDGKLLDLKINRDDPQLLVPAGVIYPALGATCTTNRQAGVVKVKFGLKTFQIRENNYDILIKDKSIMMETNPHFSGQHMMVPLRAVVESVGGGVKWDGSRKAWQVYTRDRLESLVDVMGDGMPLKTKLAGYEHYFSDDRYIYWSALRDGASIYRSDKNGKNLERLLDAATEIIGLDKDHIFYINMFDQNRMYSMKKDGTLVKQLVKGSVSDAAVNGDVINYCSLENGLSLCSVRTDGSGSQIRKEEIAVMDGDLVISQDTVLSGKNILLKGDLKISENCTLTLDKTRLVFDTGREGAAKTERRLEVKKSAALIMKESTLRTSRQDNGILFSAESAKIDIQTSRISNIISNIELNRCENVILAGNYVIDSATSGFVNSNAVNGATYKDNVIINKDRDKQAWITFLSGSCARDLKIQDNVCVDQGECLFLQYGSNGVISGNLVLGDRYCLGLSLRHNAGNSRYDNNFLQQNYNDGYKINEPSFSNAVTADTLETTTVFTRNVVNNSGNAFQMINMSNCIFDSNRAWLQMFNKYDNRTETTAVNMQYAHHNEIINNTFESWNGTNGLQAFNCTDNRVEGNTFTGFRYGIELWNKSDQNIIKGNKVIDCLSSILSNGSKDNTITRNSLVSTKNARINLYNSGINDWSANYYSDWAGSKPRSLTQTGADKNPLLLPPLQDKAQSIKQAVAFDIKSLFDAYEKLHGTGRITENQLWKNTEFHYDVGHDFRIQNNAILTLDNVTFYSPEMYSSEPEIYVESGASLILKNSRIIANPKRMPLHFRIDPGATFIAENCTFENVYELRLDGAKGSIKNCTFIDCYQALAFDAKDPVDVINCKVINSFIGISRYFRDKENGKFTGNTETNVTSRFAEPVFKTIPANN